MAAACQRMFTEQIRPQSPRDHSPPTQRQRSVEQGADTVVWLALDAPPNLTGKFLRDREVIAAVLRRDCRRLALSNGLRKVRMHPVLLLITQFAYWRTKRKNMVPLET